ncbi:hypothetical protein D3C75_656530 [compost metagenome]
MVELQQTKTFRVIVGIGVVLQLLRVIERPRHPLAVTTPHRQAIGVMNLRVNGVTHAAFIGAAGEHTGHRGDTQLLNIFTRIQVIIDIHHHALRLTIDSKFVCPGDTGAVEQRVDHKFGVACFRRFKPERSKVRELFELIGISVYRKATCGQTILVCVINRTEITRTEE